MNNKFIVNLLSNCLNGNDPSWFRAGEDPAICYAIECLERDFDTDNMTLTFCPPLRNVDARLARDSNELRSPGHFDKKI